MTLRDPRTRRPPASDTLLLTVTYQDTLVAGAKLPLSTIRFPFRFVFQPENLLVSRQAWNDEFSRQDLLVTARICRDVQDRQCLAEDWEEFPPAQSLAKLLRLEGLTVRAPVSITL